MANTITNERLQTFYVAYYGRPADPAGLDYWSRIANLTAAQGGLEGNEAAVIQNLGNTAQTEFQTIYGTNPPIATFINTIYNNLFGRDVEIEGLNYWIGEFNRLIVGGQDANAVRTAIVTYIVDGAQGTDAAAVQAKTDYAQAFTAAIDTVEEIEAYSSLNNTAGYAAARASLAGVTDAGTLATQTAAIGATVGTVVTEAAGIVTGQTLALTTGLDSIVGGSGGDSINGSLNFAADALQATSTLNPGDAVNGAAATDTFNISISGTAVDVLGAGAGYKALPTLTNVERVLVSNSETDAGADVTIDLSLADANLTTVGTSNSTAADSDTIFANAGKVLNAQMTGQGDVTIGYTGTPTAGTADALTLTLNASGSSTGTPSFVTTGIETLNVVSSAAANFVKVSTDADLDVINVSGTKDLTLDANIGTNTGVSQINASALTGALTLDASGGDADLSVTGGSGNDVINLGTRLTAADTIDGGAGTDTLRVQASATTLPGANLTSIEALDAEAVNNENLTVTTNGATTIGKVVLRENPTTGKNLSATDLAAGVGAEILQTTDNAAVGAVTVGLLDPAGTADSVTVTLKGVTGHGAADNTVASLNVTNIESLTLNSASAGTAALGATDANTITDLVGDSALTSITATGASALTVGLNAGLTKLTSFNAGAMTGNLQVTVAAGNVSVTGGSGDDTFTFGNTLNNSDTVVGGGNTKSTTEDTLTATITGLTSTTGALNVSGVERLNLTNAGTAVINAAGISGANEIAIAEDAGIVSTTISNLAAGTALGLGFKGTADADTALGTITASLADETGTADSLTVNLNDTTDADTNTVTLKTTGIETVTFAYSTTATDLASYTVTATNLKASTINVTGSTADTDNTFTLGTVSTSTTKVDASTFKGVLKAQAAAAIATTFLSDAAQADSITGDSGNDTITLVGNLGTVVHTIAGGTGTDTLNVTLNSASSDFTSVSAVENIGITVANSTTVGFDDGTKDNGLNAASVVTLSGGNSLSKFALTGTAVIDDAAKTIDASGFNGAIELVLAENALDADMTIKGGALTTDKVTTSVSTNDTGEVVKLMTGVETLVLNSVNADVNAVIDLTNVSGVTTLDAKFVNGANADQLKITNLASGVNVKATSTATGDNLVIDLAGKADAANSLNLELASFGAPTHSLNFDATGVETLNVTATAAGLLDLGGVDATGTADTVTVNVSGAAALTLKSMNADITTVNASTATGGLTIASADRTSNAMTITGGEGADTIAMRNAGDVLTGGAGSDTLSITTNAILGGFQINLASTTDQVGTFAGAANAAAQTGFENVDLTGVTGTFGAEITAHSDGSTITGSASNDQITAGAGTDNIVFAGGTPVTAGALVAPTGVDTILNFTGGTDNLVFSNTSFADDLNGVAANGQLDQAAVGVYANTGVLINAANAQIDAAGAVSVTDGAFAIVGSNTVGSTVELYFLDAGATVTNSIATEVAAGHAVKIADIAIVGSPLTLADFMNTA